MDAKLTIDEKLKDLRLERKLTLEELANDTGLSSSALASYEADPYKDISVNAMVTLAKYYGVSTDYILGLTENREVSNVEVRDLYLSDEMIALLKEGRINNLLLCEMATHEEFKNLLADIEIYVDRIAATQINTLNANVDAARLIIRDKYDPDEHDRTMKTLEAAHINEDEYFSYRIHEDIDKIIRDIKEKHVKDPMTADDSSPADEIRKQIEEAAAFEGSDQERQARIFLTQLGINYDSLYPDEFVTLINILKKSKNLKSPLSKRGKGTKKRKK